MSATRKLMLGSAAGVVGAVVLAAIAWALHLDEQPRVCVADTSGPFRTPMCPDRGDASVTALVAAGVIGFVLAASLVLAACRRRDNR
jgi:hypothetical protein